MGNDFDNAVGSGVAGAGAGAAAGTAIGAAAGATLGPFAPIAAPVGAAVGALIGFFIWLGKSTAARDAEAKARMEAAHRAHEQALNAAALTGSALNTGATYLYGVLNTISVESDPAVRLKKVNEWIAKAWPADSLKRLAAQDEAYAPIVNEMFNGLRYAAQHPGQSTASLKKVTDFAKAIGSLPGNLDADPFAYLRPPLVSVFGPALAAVGINVSDPDTLKMMRGNYDMAQYDFTNPVWSTLGLTTDMNIYGGPTEADRQKAAKAAAIFAQSVGAGRPGLATPMMGAAPAASSGFPTWGYVLLGIGVLGGGYYFLKD